MNNLINMNNFVIKDIKRKNPNHKKRHLKKERVNKMEKIKLDPYFTLYIVHPTTPCTLFIPMYKINSSYIRI